MKSDEINAFLFYHTINNSEKKISLKLWLSIFKRFAYIYLLHHFFFGRTSNIYTHIKMRPQNTTFIVLVKLTFFSKFIYIRTYRDKAINICMYQRMRMNTELRMGTWFLHTFTEQNLNIFSQMFVLKRLFKNQYLYVLALLVHRQEVARFFNAIDLTKAFYICK